jgi:hypothetical protein
MDSAGRSPREVFESHLALRQQHRLEDDLALNYDERVVQLTAWSGRRCGHDGVRAGARELRQLLPGATYEYVLREVDGEVAFLVWNARSPGGTVHGGADTFLIRGGKIVVQTIAYRVPS